MFKYFQFGGLQRDFRAIVEVCLARGHQVDVYTLEWIGDPIPGVNVHIVKRRGFTNYRCYWNFSQMVVNKLKKQGYDGIVGFNKLAGLDVYYGADPCFLEVVENNKKSFTKINPRYYYFAKLEQAIFNPVASTQVLALTEQQINNFYHYYHTPKERFHLLPPWLNANRFPPDNMAEIRHDVRKELGLKTTDKLILFVGSGFKTKGLDRALSAIASLPSGVKDTVYFYIIGDDKKEIFAQQAKSLKLENNIKFLGGRSDIPRFMFSADLLLHPAYAESGGYVLLEAIVAGLPVLTTDTCGFATHVEKAKAGIIMQSPFEQSALNQALLLMLTDKAKISDWHEHGLKYTEQCNLQGMPEIATDIIEWAARLPKATDIVDVGKMDYFIYPELQNCFDSKDPFNAVMALDGDIYRELDGRKTLAFKYKDKRYFAKLHQGAGWTEIWKNLRQLRTPIITAVNEYKAIKKVEALGLKSTPIVGFGKRGCNPAKKRSFLLTNALENTISLEDLTRNWLIEPPDFKFKNILLKEVAKIARLMHDNGVNHRDFYICHILLDQAVLSSTGRVKLYIIDLHRAQIRKTIPLRWRVKDIASLYYSALDIGLTPKDRFRFIREYLGRPLKEALAQTNLWEKIITKTYSLTKRSFKFETSFDEKKT